MYPFGTTLLEPADDRGSNWKDPHRPQPRPWMVVGTITLCWILALLGPLSMLFPLVAALAILVLLGQHRYVAAGAVAVLSPLTLGLVIGTVSYFSGSGEIVSMGLPGTTFHNLDPIARCQRSTGGCIAMGNEWIFHLPNNLAVLGLSATFGPMPGTYRGSYPNEAEAKKALTQAKVIDADDFRIDRFDVEGESIKLDRGVGAKLLDRLRYDSPINEPPAPISATLYDDCLIVRIPVDTYYPAKTPSAAIVLIGRDKGRPFAYYAEGEYSHHFTPVSWNRPADE
ncbi:hypothetical protein ACYFX5_02600 [Bremerella sp. T1]|uniref:hypothetical protein n=1 Tax=Bremerella sp. TYQ1 TaxID=3119568 RepID=UPI001CCF6F91|nr:hypothetical protein [Bremerella volcania]UBM37160.1 hypothetical protein LA756_04555 [Bremerella volcania]